MHFDASLELDRGPLDAPRPAARPAPPAGADARRRGAHLRQRRAAEAQGRAVLRPPARGSPVRRHRVARAIVHRLLRLARGGVLELREPDRPPVRFGALDPARAAARGPRGPLPRLLPRAAARQRRPRRGAHGRPVVEPRPRRARAPGRRATARRSTARAAGCARSSPRPARWGARATRVHRSRRQIAAHYDLGNDLFALFLDERMMYSSAIFPTAGATLEEAALHKLELVCRKLDLGPGDHLLEIGTGWGGLAVHAAAPLRLPRDDDDDLARAARPRRRPRCAPPAWRIGSPCCCATTASSRAATTSSSRSR